MYHVEEISCELLKKNIGEIISIDKKFLPCLDNKETGEAWKIADIAEHTHYSQALSDLLEATYIQYEAFRGE
jgi:hypothetical protein